MNATNNLNVCQRCGTANAPAANFCYQCGNTLKLGEQPLVCQKCSTVNISRAVYCKSCGVSLGEAGGERTKICPSCHNSVGEECTLCGKCGHSFVQKATTRSAANAESAVAATTRPIAPKEKVRNKPSESEAKKARIGAAVSFVVIALFALVFTLRFDKLILLGFVYSSQAQTPFGTIFSGLEIISRMLIIGQIAQLTTSEWILIILLAVTAVSAAVCLVLSVIRLINGRLPAHANYFAYAMTAISILVMGYLMLSQHAAAYISGSTGAIRKAFEFLAKQRTINSLGLGACAIPVFWLFVSVMSGIFRKVDARPKRVMDIKR